MFILENLKTAYGVQRMSSHILPIDSDKVHYWGSEWTWRRCWSISVQYRSERKGATPNFSQSCVQLTIYSLPAGVRNTTLKQFQPLIATVASANCANSTS
jgi:hypothetical protein